MSNTGPSTLPLHEFEPRSMLHTQETRLERPAHKVIDFHAHLTWSAPLTAGDDEGVTFTGSASEMLPVMDRKHVRLMVNLTGGYGRGLGAAIRAFDGPHPDRFATFTEPWWSRIESENYPNFQADQIEIARAAGAKGIKILKTLGLFLRERVNTGPLIRIDDPRFDPMWEAAGSLGMPVAIHSSDPEAFFLPIDRFNERWEELNAHPDWSFCGKDFPTDRELQEARRNVMRRHPNTTFVCLHVANSENLQYVSECMDTHPNMTVDIAARIGELGRQPAAAKRFFDRYQDRILFGTDAVPGGYDFPQQLFGDLLYEIYYRTLETDDEYFDYAPARVPPQGRWRIYGLKLSETILKKIYWQNAAALLRIAD
jgi:predicted TIM-barrel fold metal-dependent hydrolase